MASKTVVVVFTLLFLLFVAMLVCLAAFAYDDTKGSGHKEPVSAAATLSGHQHGPDTNDWGRVLNQSCPACPSTSLRGLFCDQKRFVALVDAEEEIEANEINVRRFRINVVKMFKSIEFLNQALSASLVQVRGVDVPDERCEHVLVTGKRYLVTGYLMDKMMPVIGACDLVAHWTSLPEQRRHEYINFFADKNHCYAWR